MELGRLYEFRHIKTDRLRGYRPAELSPGQQAFVASPEKALPDLIYPQAGGGYAVKGRWLWPMSGQTGAILHEWEG